MSDFIPQKQHLHEVLIFSLILRKVQQKVTDFLWKLTVIMLHLKSLKDSGSEDLRTMTSTLKKRTPRSTKKI